MGYLLAGGVVGLLGVISKKFGSDKFDVGGIPELIDQLAREEQTFKVARVEESEASEVVKNVFGSHHKYDEIQAARISGLGGVLFVLKAGLLIKQQPEFGKPHPILKSMNSGGFCISLPAKECTLLLVLTACGFRGSYLTGNLFPGMNGPLAAHSEHLKGLACEP